MALAPGYQILKKKALDQKTLGVEENQFSALAKGDFTLFLTRREMPGSFIEGNGVGVQVNLTKLPQPEGLDGNIGAFLGVAAGADALHQAISEKGEGENVLIHCKHGRERTPAIVAYYLIKHEGMTGQDAVSLVHHALRERLGREQDSERNRRNNTWLKQLAQEKIVDFEAQVVSYKGEEKPLSEHFSQLYTNKDGVRLLSGDFQTIATSNKQLKTFMVYESRRLTRSGARASASTQLRDEPAPVDRQMTDDEKMSEIDSASVPGQSDDPADRQRADDEKKSEAEPASVSGQSSEEKKTVVPRRSARLLEQQKTLMQKHKEAYAKAAKKASANQAKSSTSAPEPTRPKSSSS